MWTALRKLPLPLILVIVGSVGVAAYALFGYTMQPLGSLVHPDMQATYEANPLSVYVHIFASLTALALGPIQFFRVIRVRNVAVHRTIGRIYLIGVFIGGTAGLLISRIAFGGLVSMAGFSLLSTLWLFTAGMALHAIRSGKVEKHRRWMIRNFSLTFAAVTLRIYLGLFFAVGSSFDEFYPLLSWISWVPNLLFAEWVLLSQRWSDTDGTVHVADA